MFSRKKETPQEDKNTEIAHNFFKRYKGNANLFQLNKGEKKLIKNDMVVSFRTDNNDFDFFVVLSTEEKAWKPYFFPVLKDCGIKFEEVSQERLIAFNFSADLSQEVLVRLEFPIQGENFEEASKFMQIFVRLMWQTENRKIYTQADKSFDWNTLCPRINQQKVAEINPGILKLFENLSDESSIDFLGIGHLYSNTDTQSLQIDGDFLYALRNTEPHVYQMEIYDGDGKMIYHKNVDQNLYYTINEDLNNINWTDEKSGVVINLSFAFKEASSAANLAVVMSIDILTASQLRNFNDIMKDSDKKDWEQFYGHCTNDGVEDSEFDDSEEEDYSQYFGAQNQNTDIDFAQGFSLQNKQERDFSTLAQAKLLDRTFVAQGNIINVYKENDDDDNHLEHIIDLPPLMSLSGDVVNPNKMILTEQDTKVLIKDNTIGNTVFFMDLEKGKVIQELTTNNYLEDIAPSGKLSFMGTDSMFYACARQNIMMMDPRTASSVVQQRPYATDYKFNTITTAQNGQYAVGSSNGEIRLYGSVGGNAKNVIPSFNNEAILSMDASKDGKFLLTCTKSNVMLIKTSQAGKNGFDYMFRKGDKPRPIPLKIHASALAKHGIAKPQFKFAKFDQKEKGLESFIVACVGEHMIFWSMKKLQSKNYATRAIKNFGAQIVSNEFKFNTHKLVAALPKNVVLQETKISNIK